MNKRIDYYLALQSPWTYLGHERLLSIAERHGAAVRAFPIDFGTVFPATGGLPLPKRSPERQAYRMMELRRWRDHLGVPLTLEPKFFPVDQNPASHMVIAARRRVDPTLPLIGAILRAVWAEEKDIADGETLRAIAASCGLDAEALLSAAAGADNAETVASDTQAAIDRGVFGAPTYVYRDELFWGQDRLEFLARALAA